MSGETTQRGRSVPSALTVPGAGDRGHGPRVLRRRVRGHPTQASAGVPRSHDLEPRGRRRSGRPRYRLGPVRLGHGITHRERRCRDVHHRAHGPFPQPAAQVLAAWADGGIDISEPSIHLGEPLAVKAIHDANFATPPDTWGEYLHRLQYLAEMKVGAAHRSAVRQEDAAVAKAVGNAERG